MSEAKFTEGPWQSQGDFDMESVCRIIGAIDGPDDGRFHYKLVCEIDPDGSQDTAEQYANARLIAAAPDLYEALDFALLALMGVRAALVDMSVRPPPLLDNEIARARAALAKVGVVSAQAQSGVPE